MNIILNWLAFLVISVGSSRLGIYITLIKFPVIFGYVIVGVLCGPYILNLVPSGNLYDLHYITQFAVAFIAYSAGAELYLPELRALFKRIVWVTCWMAAITFTLVSVVWWILSQNGLIGWILPYSSSCQLTIGMIVGSIMVERSPAAVIAVVRELRAKGEFTSTILGVTVFCDVFVLVLFTFTSNLTHTYCAGVPFNIVALLISLGNIVAAIVFGWVLGQVLIVLLWADHWAWPYTIPPLGFLCFLGSESLVHFSLQQWKITVNLDPLLICIVAGYIATNQSRNRRKLLHFLAHVSPYIFIPFFTLTGANIKLDLFATSMSFAPIIVLVRMFSIFVGSFIGGHFTGMPSEHKSIAWLGMISQAGLSLGLAAEVASDFDDFGPSFATALISIILLNLIIGPVMCKLAIFKSGDGGKGGEEEEEHGHINQAILVGVDSATMAIAQKLLCDDWNVIYYDRSMNLLQRALDLLQVPKPEVEGIMGIDNIEKAVSAVGDAVESAVNSAMDRAKQMVSMNKSDVNAAAAEASQAVSDATPNAVALAKKKLRKHNSNADDTAVEVEESGEQEDAEEEEATQLSTRLLKTDVDIADAFEAEASDLMGPLAPPTRIAVIHLPNDADSYKLALFLQHKLQVHRVIVRLHNLAWANVCAQNGIIAIYDSQLYRYHLEQLVVNEHGPLISHEHDAASWPQASLAVIDPTGRSASFESSLLSEMQRSEWLTAHPAPTAEFIKAMESIEGSSLLANKHVAASQREEYLETMQSLHMGVSVGTTEHERNVNSSLFVSAMHTLEQRDERAGIAASSKISAGMFSNQESVDAANAEVEAAAAAAASPTGKHGRRSSKADQSPF
jgi:Kef-type K+ transport system membrane component KefB